MGRNCGGREPCHCKLHMCVCSYVGSYINPSGRVCVVCLKHASQMSLKRTQYIHTYIRTCMKFQNNNSVKYSKVDLATLQNHRVIIIIALFLTWSETMHTMIYIIILMIE